MRHYTRLAAAVLAAASLAAVSAAPAVAQTDVTADPNPCLADPSLPTCVNYVFDVADRTLVYADNAYDTHVQPQLTYVACTVVDLLTDDEC
jgi:hypothetical protein